MLEKQLRKTSLVNPLSPSTFYSIAAALLKVSRKIDDVDDGMVGVFLPS